MGTAEDRRRFAQHVPMLVLFGFVAAISSFTHIARLTPATCSGRGTPQRRATTGVAAKLRLNAGDGTAPGLSISGAFDSGNIKLVEVQGHEAVRL